LSERACGFDSHQRHQNAMEGKSFVSDNNLLAYIIGLAIGDGTLSNPSGRGVCLRITCDTRYPQLIRKIQSALRMLLPNNRVGWVKKRGNCGYVYCYSNRWPKLLGWEVGQGSKFTQRVTVPLWVLTNREYTINCLRGFIETDGSIYSDRGYPMMMFVTIIEELAENFEYMVHSLGFLPKTYKITRLSNPNAQTLYHIRLPKNVKEFLQLVQPQKI
jgi:hypothetical protein